MCRVDIDLGIMRTEVGPLLLTLIAKQIVQRKKDWPK